MKGAWHRWIGPAASARVAVPLLVAALSAVGFFVTSRAVDADLRSDANRRAEQGAQQARAVLERAGAVGVGLGNALEGERVPSSRRFAALASNATTPLGLPAALWVEQVTAAGRHGYERRIGAPIVTLAGGRPAPPAEAYLAATFVTGLPLPQGSDLSSLSGLADTLRDPTSVFAGTATPVEVLAGRRGFFIVQGTRFGRGPGSRGFLVIFAPAGWLSLSLNENPDRSAISLDGERLAGTQTTAAASDTFEALTRSWRVDVAEEDASGVQAVVPWLAAAWPPATALLVYLVGRAMLRRRRAEREVDDIFDLSLDLLCILGVDGCLMRVNPAFERTLGFTAAELQSRPLLEFVEPADRETVAKSIAVLREANETARFESRFVRADGSVRWLRWSARPMAERGRVYAAAHDVTDTRTLLSELAASRRRIAATADETRRRIERDLHDGAQQRQVQTIFALKAVQHALENGSENAAGLVETALESAENANDELRELARGIHPGMLAKGGLAPTLKMIARRSPVPVTVELQSEARLPESVELTAYYVVSEALTNAAKHSGASTVRVAVDKVDDQLRVSISDDGVGGADPAGGSGLVGLKDRVEAAGGTLTVRSPAGEGTHLTVELPAPARE